MLQPLDEGKGTFLFVIGTKPGLDAVALLPNIGQAALAPVPNPKPLRWGRGRGGCGRPAEVPCLHTGPKGLWATPPHA